MEYLFKQDCATYNFKAEN